MKAWLAILLAALSLPGCGQQGDGASQPGAKLTTRGDQGSADQSGRVGGQSRKKSKREGAGASDEESAARDDNAVGSKDNASKEKKNREQDEDEDEDVDEDEESDGESTVDPSALKGQEYFEGPLYQLFANACASCHADPRQNPPMKGPLTIFSYAKMKQKLDVGQSPFANAFIDKVRSLDAHAGGDRCPGGYAASPCKEIADWWILEHGPAPDGTAMGRVGLVNSISPLGKVYGWAQDPGNPGAAIAVRLFVDGPLGTGTELGAVMASLDGDDGGTPGAHAFIFELPENLKDQKPHKLYAYANIGGTETLLGDDGSSFTAYGLSEAGRSFFQNNVQGQLGGCGGCHAVAYEQQFYSLVSPAPSKGGQAGNNQLVNKPAQANGITHGGGSFCNGANQGLCATIQEWWRVEFGAP